ncbi:MAG: polynucleotide adenylyltransferase PcnB [Zoogloeaceae bacterium]|jgi:poly(A) polymerase|nr:polynucleotide adenylyltransferase PcnB [Zoogloeaceae bacterium]
MLRKFINRVFKRDDALTAREPAIIPVSSHGVSRDQISSGSRRVCEALRERGYKAYVVGGAVRDLLARVTPKDFDVATDATPDEVRRCLRRSRIVGRRFQIVHAYMGQEVVEITTFRGALGDDAKTDAHGRVLRDNIFGSQAEDAARRDFTVNALYFDPATEQILDYHHGVADLRQKTLRVIGDPRTRYREDPIRMLRAIRLAAKLGLAIDPAARRPIREMAILLENIPAARLSDEIFKLLSSGHAARCLRQLHAEGLHQGTLPLLDVLLRTPESEQFIMLAMADTDARIQQGKSSSPCFLFAALLWRELGIAWQALRETGEHPLPALHRAMNDVLSAQGQKLAITRRIAGDIKEIWALQSRFEHRVGRHPYGVLAHPRFRAAYEFLRLRAKAGEIDAALPAWWLEFQNADSDARNGMLSALAPESAKRRGRRRSRRGGKREKAAANENAAADFVALPENNRESDGAA